MTHLKIYLTPELEKKLKAYRQNRKIERKGKAIRNVTAVEELLEIALTGVEPEREISLENVLARVKAIEGQLATSRSKFKIKEPMNWAVRDE